MQYLGPILGTLHTYSICFNWLLDIPIKMTSATSGTLQLMVHSCSPQRHAPQFQFILQNIKTISRLSSDFLKRLVRPDHQTSDSQEVAGLQLSTMGYPWLAGHDWVNPARATMAPLAAVLQA
jgi:hypothetical protein